MFKRLVSQLPYSPTLLNQVAFYIGRLKAEELSRRVGMFVMAFALLLQTYAFIAPPQASLASSTNDVIFGGGSKEQLLASYRANTDELGRTDIQAIYQRFGIGEAELEAAELVTIQSREANNFWSVGRHPRFGEQIERSVNIPGHDPVYIRPLHAWDSGAYSTYEALKGTTTSGKDFWILTICGNPVITGGIVDELEAELQISKNASPAPDSTVQIGDEISYRLLYRNVGPGEARFMDVQDGAPQGTEFVRIEQGPLDNIVADNGQIITWWHDVPDRILGVSDFWHTIEFVVRVTSDDLNQICNVATISALNQQVQSNSVCHNVEKPTPPEPEQPPAPVASYACTNLSWSLLDGSTNRGQFTVTASAENTAITGYQINTGDSPDPLMIDSSEPLATIEYTYPDTAANYQASATLITESGSHSSSDCIRDLSIEPEVVVPQVSFACTLLSWTLLPDESNPLATAEQGLTGRFTTVGEASNVAVNGYRITLTDAETGFNVAGTPITVQSSELSTQTEYSFAAAGNYTASAAILTAEGQATDAACELNLAIVEPPTPCPFNPSISTEDDNCAPPPPETPEEPEPPVITPPVANGTPKITYQKLVANDTQGIENANNTIAQPGDSLRYTLVTSNEGDGIAETYSLPPEVLADVLEYSELVEIGDGSFDDASKTLTWPAVDLSPGESVEKTVVVKIFDELPQTNISASDAASYDFVLNNGYGDKAVEVRLPRSTAKTVEIINRTLPKTGADVTMLLTTGFFGIVTYFYFRSRLLRKELGLIKQDYSGGLA